MLHQFPVSPQQLDLIYSWLYNWKKLYRSIFNLPLNTLPVTGPMLSELLPQWCLSRSLPTEPCNAILLHRVEAIFTSEEVSLPNIPVLKNKFTSTLIKELVYIFIQNIYNIEINAVCTIKPQQSQTVWDRQCVCPVVFIWHFLRSLTLIVILSDAQFCLWNVGLYTIVKVSLHKLPDFLLNGKNNGELEKGIFLNHVYQKLYKKTLSETNSKLLICWGLFFVEVAFKLFVWILF